MKKFFLIILLTFTGSAIAGFLYFEDQATLLVNHYPVWDFKTKKYKLVKKKPLHWVSLKDISHQAKWAIMISEDWAFFDHKGLDFNQLQVVLEESFKQKKLVRGASTITQQVVKNTLLSSEKSLTRKFKEMVLAFMIEQKLSKERILEIYLNLIELGVDLYGIKNASYFYFKKSPSKLNAKEGAFLAMLLPSPKRYSQSYRDRKLTKFAAEQVDKILGKLKMAKVITEDELFELQDHQLSFEVKLPTIESIEAPDGMETLEI